MHLEDMRVKKTKRNIRNSFLELIMVKDISKITVKELSEKAEINRKTFYMHYASVYDVMEEIENEIIQRLKSILEKYNYFNNPSNISFLFLAMNDVVNEDYAFYKKMLNSTSYTFFVNKVKIFFKKTLVTQYATNSALDEQVLSLYAEYISTGVISMYVEWIQGRTLLSLEEMAEYATNIFWHGTSIIANK